jgi:hypothetical protein
MRRRRDLAVDRHDDAAHASRSTISNTSQEPRNTLRRGRRNENGSSVIDYIFGKRLQTQSAPTYETRQGGLCHRRSKQKFLSGLGTTGGATYTLKREVDGKIRMTSMLWEDAKRIGMGEVREVRNVDGRLYIAHPPPRRKGPAARAV